MMKLPKIPPFVLMTGAAGAAAGGPIGALVGALVGGLITKLKKPLVVVPPAALAPAAPADAPLYDDGTAGANDPGSPNAGAGIDVSPSSSGGSIPTRALVSAGMIPAGTAVVALPPTPIAPDPTALPAPVPAPAPAPQPVAILPPPVDPHIVRQSPSGAYKLLMQDDGNLVLYSARGALWASNTMGSGANAAVMQSDGNFVVYAGPVARWSSRTQNHPGAILVLQDDGNLVIYYSGAAIWATNTVQR